MIENSWNSPSRSSPKIYKFYHENQIKKQSHIQNLQFQQSAENKNKSQEKIQYYLYSRSHNQQTLEKRKIERSVLQDHSCQKNFQPILTPGINQRPYLNRLHKDTAQKGRPDFLWNKLNLLNSKHINNQILQKVIDMEEQCIKDINSKIDQDKIQQMQQLEYQKAKHIEIRNKLLQKHQENFDFEKKVGLVPEIKPLVVFESFNYQSQSQSLQRSNLSQNQPTIATKYIEPNQSAGCFSYSRNSKYSDQQKEVKNLDRTEFRGLLLAEIDAIKSNINSEFNKTVIDYISNQSSRPSTKSSKFWQTKTKIIKRPDTTDLIIEKKQESDKQNNDIEYFEKNISGSVRRVGFPNTQLIQLQS